MQGPLPCRRGACWQPGPSLRGSGKEESSPHSGGRLPSSFCGTATTEGCWVRGRLEALVQAEGRRSVSAQLFYIYFIWYVFALFIGPPCLNVCPDKTHPVRLKAPLMPVVGAAWVQAALSEAQAAWCPVTWHLVIRACLCGVCVKCTLIGH